MSQTVFIILHIYRQTLQITVSPYSGQKFDGRPDSRGYELHIFGCWPGRLYSNYLREISLYFSQKTFHKSHCVPAAIISLQLTLGQT